MKTRLLVISDLHLGGAPATGGKPAFDVADFLAEARAADDALLALADDAAACGDARMVGSALSLKVLRAYRVELEADGTVTEAALEMLRTGRCPCLR